MRALATRGIDTAVMQTRDADRFVGTATFEALTGEPVIVDGTPSTASSPHLDAGRRADALVVAPATANTIAKMASGIADDVVTPTYLGYAGPVIVRPAMNVRMYHHPATQRNLKQLSDAASRSSGRPTAPSHVATKARAA